MTKKMILPVFLSFFFLNLVNAEVLKNPSGNIDTWYSTGTFYELFVRSFKDTNADKYGDFNGVTEKIDYLKKLGVSSLWLMPINDSSEHTNNYDVVNFMDVDPTYGTIDDFKNLLNKAHENDIKIILDLVVNHTSSKHPFFIDATTNSNSKYRDWYVFSETKPEGKWSKYWHETPVGYYYAYFVDSKPDLNYKNPQVISYMKDVMKFWLDLGVDGFRFDAVTLLVENGDGLMKNQKESYDVYKSFRSFIDENYSDRDIFTVAESEPPYNSYLGNGSDMFNAVFNFRFPGSVIRMIKDGNPYSSKGVDLLESIVKNYVKDLKDAQGGFYGTLLSNHDIYAGLRPFRQFEGNIEKTKLAGSVLLTMPGIPFVYYGEEIGLDTYTRSKSDRWLRNCMIWDEGKNFGFSDSNGSWTMINTQDDEVNRKSNVSVLEKDEKSILNKYRELIHIRRENKALSIGDYEALVTNNKLIGAYLRKYQDEEVIVLHNFSDKQQSFSVTLSESSADKNGFDVLTTTDVKVTIGKKVLKVTRLSPLDTLIIKLK